MNHLYYGDNLKVLRESIADESVDLVYLDPPFNSNASYNVLFKAPDGDGSQAQIEAFDDTWHWTDAAESAWHEVVHGPSPEAAEMLRAMRSFLGENDMMAYLAMMAVRMLELHRVLKPTGSLYLHCDPTASHYLKILLDAVFGAQNFRNEIIWKRTSAHSSAKRFGPVHDTIIFTTKSEKYTWNKAFQPIPQETIDAWYNNIEPETGRRYNRADITAAGKRSGPSGQAWRGIDPTAKGRHWAIPGYLNLGQISTQEALDILDRNNRLHWPKKKDGMPMFKRYLDESPGIPALDVITDIHPLNNVAKERLGYPTQKPVALLERIVAASSNPGDVVLDPFCGCGTTVHAAEKLGRRWIGIDVTHIAIDLIRRRLSDAFGAELKPFDLHGAPTDLGGAKALAEHDKHQFELWAVSKIPGAQPFKGGRKGADRGIDGVFYVTTGAKKSEKGIVSVKGGANVNVGMIRDLKGVLERERAEMGVFITLAPPTRPMREEAAAAGLWDTGYGEPVPRLQIVTVEEILDAGPRAPIRLPVTSVDRHRKAKREGPGGGASQGALDL